MSRSGAKASKAFSTTQTNFNGPTFAVVPGLIVDALLFFVTEDVIRHDHFDELGFSLLLVFPIVIFV
jgi:hypothetical protein